MQGIASGGGIGMQGNPAGGGPGSVTIGIQGNASADNVNFELNKQKGEEFMNDKIGELYDALAEISALLKEPNPDNPKIRGIVDRIKDWKWVPESILGVINVVTALSGCI